MKKFAFSLSLMVLFLFAGPRCLSQSNSVLTTLKKVETERLLMPKELQILGAKTYEVEKIGFNQIEIKFFNETNNLIGTVNLTESISDSSLFVSLTEGGSQDWVRITRTQSQGEAQIRAITSSGTELFTKIARETSSTGSRSKVSLVSIKMGGTTWQDFPAGGTGSPEERSALSDALQTEEARLFNSDRLRKLKECIRGLDVLKSSSSDETGQQLDATCADDRTPIWVEPMPAYRVVRPGCSGTAVCFRIATVIAVFFCNGGDTCTGVYIIPDYIFRIVFVTNCGYLNNCA